MNIYSDHHQIRYLRHDHGQYLKIHTGYCSCGWNKSFSDREMMVAEAEEHIRESE